MKRNRLFCLLLSLVLLTGLLAIPAMATGIQVQVTTSHKVTQGEILDLHCTASSELGLGLSYLWYETASGKLADIFAVNRGAETNATLRCDTSEVGTRYYVCMVSDGVDSVYSDVIEVRVLSGTDDRTVVFTTDSEPVTGGAMTVDIEKMIDYDAGLYNAFLEGKIGYEWYRDGAKVKNTAATMKFSDADAGCTCYVLVKGYGITLKSEEFVVEKLIVAPEIETTMLPEGTVGQAYSAQLKCYEDGAEFTVYYNPGKANDFEKTGLKLAEDGKITGTPAKAGSFTFTVCAGNDGGEDYATYTLTVKEAPTDPTETTEGATQPTQTVIPSDPDEQKDVPVIAPAPTDPVETTGEAGSPRSLGVVIAIVIALAVLAGAAAIVVIVILIARRKQ